MFEQLIDQYRDLMKGMSRQLRYFSEIDSAIAVDDIYQEAFIVLTQAARTFTGPQDAFRPYLRSAIKKHMWKLVGLRGGTIESANSNTMSLDANLSDDDDGRWIDMLPDEQTTEGAFLQAGIRKDIVTALAGLTDRERQIVAWRFIDEWPGSAIARRIGLTAREYRLIERRTCAKLRAALEERGYGGQRLRAGRKRRGLVR